MTFTYALLSFYHHLFKFFKDYFQPSNELRLDDRPQNKVKSLEIGSPVNVFKNAGVENEELFTFTGRVKSSLKTALSTRGI